MRTTVKERVAERRSYPRRLMTLTRLPRPDMARRLREAEESAELTRLAIARWTVELARYLPGGALEQDPGAKGMRLSRIAMIRGAKGRLACFEALAAGWREELAKWPNNSTPRRPAR